MNMCGMNESVCLCVCVSVGVGYECGAWRGIQALPVEALLTHHIFDKCTK